MTLATAVALRGGNPRELFMHMREMIGTKPDTKIHEGTAYLDAGFLRLSNPIGIGLPGILDVEYAPDGPMLAKPSPDEDDDDREWRESDPTQNGWAGMEVGFDTGYSYRHEVTGATCDDLHAWFVLTVGKWADERGIDWQWKNEYTGEWHHGDRVEAALAFGDAVAGDPLGSTPRDPDRPVSAAQEWFLGTALPAIALDIASRR